MPTGLQTSKSPNACDAVGLLNARQRRGGVDNLERHGVRDDFSNAEDAVVATTVVC